MRGDAGNGEPGTWPEILTVNEVARYLRLAEATVYKLAQAGGIPAARVGGVWRFSRRLLDEWLDQQMRANLAPEPGNGTAGAHGEEHSGDA